MNCGVGHRCSTDLVLLWLWYRPAVVALIRPLAWESPYAIGAALKKKKNLTFMHQGTLRVKRQPKEWEKIFARYLIIV